jgi:cytochrome b561
MITEDRWFLALPAASTGVAGLLLDWTPEGTASMWLNIHALFGAVLCLSVAALFARQTRGAAPRSVPAIAAIARRLSREVYLVLYVLAAVRQFQCLFTSVSMADGMKGLQFYFAYGVLALGMIRILAALYCYPLRPHLTWPFRRSNNDATN